MHNNKIITDEQAMTSRKLKNEGITHNMNSKCKAVEIEEGFELYRAIYQGLGKRHGDDWAFVFASTSDEKAIKFAHSQEPESMRCYYVNRLILREEGEPSSIIIWGN